MVSSVHLLKRLVRPLIPDRVMARYRLHQHSKHSRVNVDVFLDDERLAKRWLAVTPDTYRARLDQPVGTFPDDSLLVGDEGLPVTEQIRSMARSLFIDPEISVVVVAETSTPGLVDRRRVEPDLGPRLIVADAEALAEVGGSPDGEHPLPGLLARVHDAGYHIGLIPMPRSGAPVNRSDPIEGHPVVILAAVPMHDVGGGARSTQLALELLREGFHVTLVSLYHAQETIDLGLRFIHPRLEQYAIADFDPDLTKDRAETRGTVILEAPAQPLIGAGLALQEGGWRLTYDLIDDWSDPALGAEWYRPDLEKRILVGADSVIASAPDLVSRAELLGRADASLVPNAVNSRVFGVDLPPRPHDLPQAETFLGYHGSLYGDWFDWGVLRQVAEMYPDAAVVLIGDVKQRPTGIPDNVHFLGLKPQGELPAYVQRFDVGLIPFRVTKTTHAVSPLKAYEYLASGVPVAAPPLRALQGLHGVHLDKDLTVAIKTALTADPPDRAVALSEHSWQARVAALRLGTPDHPESDPALVRLRPPIHHSRSARLIR